MASGVGSTEPPRSGDAGFAGVGAGNWQPVVGLEIHVQLKTRTKMFCRCANGFGGGENTQTCPVCLGFPGALPVVNRRAIEWTIKLGLALDCEIAPHAVFARKNYFYPDLPKGYQISQYDLPSCTNGKVLVPTAEGDHEIGIVRAHLEEDAAKTTHVGGRTGRIGGASTSLIDFNRGGTPLVEIVTGPDVHSSEDARRFLQLLRQTIVELGISDAEMEKGTLRVDANVSVRPEGSSELRTRCELKNMNSFRFVAQGIDAEVARQIAVYESGGEVIQETYDFDAGSGTLTARRSKEEADDYRYFPEPDLVPVEPPEDLVERLRAEVPESPARRIRRIEAELDLDRAVVLVTGGLDGLWQATVAAGADRLAAANLIANRLAGVDGGAVDPAELARLVEARDRIPRTALDEALGKVAEPGFSAEQYLADEAVSDTAELEPIVARILDANPGQVAAYKGGKEGLLGFFVGQVMKETGGKANARAVSELVREKLSSLPAMNPDFRKVALIAASLGLLISLFFALRPDDDDDQAAQTTTAQTTTEAPPATTTEQVTTEAPPAATTQAPETVRINYVIVGGQPKGGIARDSVARGRIVVITVTSDVADHVHVHGYDLMADVAPGKPATIRFTADAPGRFEIELEDTGVQIAELEVRPLSLLAHGFGGVKDLPIPEWLFFWGGAVVLVLSFLALGVLWTRPQLERRAAGRPLPRGLERVLRSQALRVVLGALSAGLLLLVFLTALIGEPVSTQNLAPTFIYIVFWLGVVLLQVLFGNVWRVLNPWLAIADGVAWLWRRLGQEWTPPLEYPQRLGVWPGAVLLACFAALELAYAEPASPRALALAVALYSYAMWFGMAAYGRRAWDEHGNGFTVYFGLFARIAPFGEHEGRLVFRTPFSGLAGAERTPGMLAFVAVMLGSVGFDGLSRAPFWQNLRADLEGPYVVDAPRTAELISTGLALAGLFGCILLVAGAYLGAIRIAESMVASERPLAPEFIQSLVPIALVYAVAHYFSAFVITGQYIFSLASDPFGFGWDLFGTVTYSPNIAPFPPNVVWYVQFGALVAGHVAGLAVAHDRAVTLLPKRDALRSQYAMLGLMVLYTVGGLWLLSR